jgi:hypothetical protein
MQAHDLKEISQPKKRKEEFIDFVIPAYESLAEA